MPSFAGHKRECRKRDVPRQQFVCQATQCILITQGTPVAGKTFGRHICSRIVIRFVVERVPAHTSEKTTVCQEDRSLSAKNDICGFKIIVQTAMGMEET